LLSAGAASTYVATVPAHPVSVDAVHGGVEAERVWLMRDDLVVGVVVAVRDRI
jgi:hypothetical protein